MTDAICSWSFRWPLLMGEEPVNGWAATGTEAGWRGLWDARSLDCTFERAQTIAFSLAAVFERPVLLLEGKLAQGVYSADYRIRQYCPNVEDAEYWADSLRPRLAETVAGFPGYPPLETLELPPPNQLEPLQD